MIFGKKKGLWCVFALAVALAAAGTPAHAQFKHLYVANFSTNTISGYTIDSSTGALTAIAGSPFALGAGETGPTQVTVAQFGSAAFAIVSNFSSNNVAVFSVARTTGVLTEIVGSPFAAGSGPLSVQADSFGDVYVANALGNSVSGYEINSSTGALTAVPGSPFSTAPAGTGPVSVAIDSGGQWAYTANLFTNNISGWSINPGPGPNTGVLTPIAGMPFATGHQCPESIVVVKSFAYAANECDNFISGFSVDQTTGALTSLPAGTVATGNAPVLLGVAGNQAFLFSPNYDDSTVSGYSFNSSTGALTSLGAAVATGNGPIAIAFGGFDNQAYVINSLDNTIKSYNYNEMTGSLTPIVGTTAVGTYPISAATSQQ